jgi:branched-chain amino acid transport system ATP-binding protein
MSKVLLETHSLSARYGSVEVVHDINLAISSDETVVLLGPNGAGKTTLLRAISRMVATRGHVAFAGTDITNWRAARAARAGIGHVPEGRGTFVDLTVGENLHLGAMARPRALRGSVAVDLERVYETFPMLADKRRAVAGILSGGQQQVLAVARALMGRPRLLLIDEPSLGLAPIPTRELFAALTQVKADWSTSLLIAEQNARLSLQVADRVVVLTGGRVAAIGTAAEIGAGDLIKRAYLGEVHPTPNER